MADRIPTVAVIPTRDRVDLVIPLALALLEQPELDHLIILDNSGIHGHEIRSALPGSDRVRVIDAPDRSIYWLWNYGWRLAVESMGNWERQVNVAILNDDIDVPPDLIGELSRWLRAGDSWLVFPDIHAPTDGPIPGKYRLKPSAGTYREGGMCGWCFMLRGELLDNPLPPIDEQFEWWCGDDDLVAQIAKAGGTIARVEGLPVGHQGESTASLHAWTHRAKAHDLVRFDNKYRQMTL